MGLLKFLIGGAVAIIAVVAGLFAAAVAALVALAVFAARRLLSARRASLPSHPPPAPAPARRQTEAGGGDVIDVTATEVPTQQAER